MAFSSNQGGDQRALAEINVTPLVDVMLVLLIIFMITAPMLQSGIEIELPKASAGSIDKGQEEIIVSVTKEGGFFLGDAEHSLENLAGAVEAERIRLGRKEVFLRGDTAVPYGLIVKVMARLKAAGIEELGMLTEEEITP